MGWLDSIGSVVTGGLGSLFNGADAASDFLDPLNAFHEGKAERTANKQWMYEYQLQKQNFEESKSQNEWNRSMQEQSFEYQKALNQLQMEREDTATARRVADLKASGLSPTLAAGSAADTGALHAGSVSQVSPAHAVPAGDFKVRAAMFKEQMFKDNLQLATTLMGNFADVARTKAETQLINAQTDQLSSITPVELKLKEQMLEFNEEFNPFRIADTISSIENRKADTYYKERQKFLVDSQILLNHDEHGMNIFRQVGLALDNDLKRTRLSLDNQMYIKNAISIELLRQEYRHKEDIFEFNKNFYNKSWNVPQGFNLTPWTSFFGVPTDEHGNIINYNTVNNLADRKVSGEKHPLWDEPVNEFVLRQFEKATNFLKETGIYKTLMKIVTGQYSTGGPFDFTNK